MAVVEKPLTVLHLTLRAVLGGVTRHIADLGTELTARGHRILAAGAPGPWGSLLSAEGIPWHDLPLSGGPLDLWRSAGAIGRIAQREHVDVIHCHFRRPLLAARLSNWRRRACVPIVFTLHLAPVPISGIHRWFSDWGDLLVAPSEQARQWITHDAGLESRRVTLVPHGVDPRLWTIPDAHSRQSARKKLQLADDAVVAAFVGRFQYPKNEDWVIDVAAATRRRGINALFVMCGDGPHAEALRQRTRSEGLDDVIRWPGYVDPLPVYHSADLLLLPSSVEGFAYVAAEAASCGVAVLRTRTAGWHETVCEGVTGHVVGIDRNEFVDAAVRMLADVGQLRRMGESGAALVHAKLSLDRQVCQTIDVYRRAMAQRGSTSTG